MKSIRSFIKLSMRIGPLGLISIIGISVSNAILPYINLWFSAEILNRVLAGDINGGIKSAILLIGSSFSVNMIANIFMHGIWYCSATWSNTMDFQVFKKSLSINYSTLETRETMEEISRTKTAAMSMGGFFRQLRYAMSILTSTISIVVAFVIVLRLFVSIDYSKENLIKAIGIIIGFILLYAVTTYLAYLQNKKYQNVVREHMQSSSKDMGVGMYWLNNVMNIDNAKDMRLYNMNDVVEKNIVSSLCGKENRFHKFARNSGKNAVITCTLNRISEMSSFIFVAIQAVMKYITIGEIMLYYGAINKFTSELVILIETVTKFNVLQEYLDGFNIFLDKEDRTLEGKEKIDEAIEYEVEFVNVSFSYPGSNDKIINNLSMKFELNKTTGIVGRNGSGKSTLVKLLCGLYEPTEGQIRINGKSIKEYDSIEYMKLFSVVFQDFELFSFALDENICCGENIDYEKVREVLSKVSLLEKVENMQNGMKTHLNNDNGAGVNFSGGEAQQVAIARALYKNAPFIILDEPTAALDPIMEMKIYNDLEKMIKGKTAVFISHRMGSCKFCDNIIVIDGGKVAERGSHDELISKKGIYEELFRTQEKLYIS